MPLSAANKKVSLWEDYLTKHERPILLSRGIGLTLNPMVPRGSFPSLTPFRIVDRTYLVNHILQLPSVAWTALGSTLYGFIVACCLLVRKRISSSPSEGTGRVLRVFSFLLRSAVVVLSTVVYARWFQKRVVNDGTISKIVNVSGSPQGPCMVGVNVVSVTNSHAGTHADMPYHYSPAPRIGQFSEAHYSGECVVVDISYELEERNPALSLITPDVLKEAFQKIPNSALPSEVFRLLLVTRRLNHSSDEAWDENYAYFDRSAIDYLSRRFPCLLLIAIDSPSVDGENASPIVEFSHGALLRNGIANLENIDARGIYGLLSATGFSVGVLSTTFSRTENYADSRGCSLAFTRMK